MRRQKLGLWSIGALAGIGMVLSLTLHTAAIGIVPRLRLTPMDRQAAQAMNRISQQLIQELSVPTVRVNLCSNQLPAQTKLTLYADAEELQSLRLSGSVATMPLAPGRYWIETQTGQRTYFTVKENASITQVSGFGYTDGELLWLTSIEVQGNQQKSRDRATAQPSAQSGTELIKDLAQDTPPSGGG